MIQHQQPKPLPAYIEAAINRLIPDPDGTPEPERPPLDLSTIPTGNWNDHLYSTVKIPPTLQSYINNTDGLLNQNELDNLEIALEKHYQLTKEHYIAHTINTSPPEFKLHHHNPCL
jgi:hypothetical protein